MKRIEALKEVGDVVATGMTIGVVINWLTVASLVITLIGGILTIVWWWVRFREWRKKGGKFW